MDFLWSNFVADTSAVAVIKAEDKADKSSTYWGKRPIYWFLSEGIKLMKVLKATFRHLNYSKSCLASLKYVLLWLFLPFWKIGLFSETVIGNLKTRLKMFQLTSASNFRYLHSYETLKIKRFIEARAVQNRKYCPEDINNLLMFVSFRELTSDFLCWLSLLW